MTMTTTTKRTKHLSHPDPYAKSNDQTKNWLWAKLWRAAVLREIAYAGTDRRIIEHVRQRTLEV